ncbi:MAG: FtsX-like permease family protein [Eubacteriales bacterium]|jgi:hypothetical protein
MTKAKLLRHYIKANRGLYRALFVQTMIVFALLFVVANTNLSVELQLRRAQSAADADVYGIMYEFGDESSCALAYESIAAEIGEESAEMIMKSPIFLNVSLKIPEQAELMEKIRAAVDSSGVDYHVYTKNAVKQVEQSGAGALNFAGILKLLLLIVMTSAALGLVGVLLISLYRREYDLSVRYVCGASKSGLTAATLFEYFLVTFAGAAAGTALGALLSPLMGSFAVAGAVSFSPKIGALKYGLLVYLFIIIVTAAVTLIRLRAVDMLDRVRYGDNI